MATAESLNRPLEQSPDVVVKLGTWLRFLVGSRESILRIARSRQALWLGLVFVLSTGLAREYDGADLWHEPWHLLLPLAASLGTSLILWTLVYLGAKGRGLAQLGFWSGYRTLLTFYWMTAPLAWIYAIPVERLLSPRDAMAANLWMLFGVSVWRVLLITRAVSVWLSAPVVVIFFLVLFFADSVAVALAYVTPAPIFNIMGGVRMSEPDSILASTTFTVMMLGMMSWLIWLLVAAIIYAVVNSPWSLAVEPDRATRISRPLWALSVLLLGIGIGLLPVGQSEQRHARQAAELLHANDVARAIEYIARFARDDFPPVWDPPPRIGYYEERPDVMDVLAEIERQNAPGWIARLYIDKIAIAPVRALSDATTEEIERVLAILEKRVPRSTLDANQVYDLRQMANDPKISHEHGERLRAYLGDSANDE